MKVSRFVSLLTIILSFCIDATQPSTSLGDSRSGGLGPHKHIVMKYDYLTEKDFSSLEAVSSHGRDDDVIDEPASRISITLRAIYLSLIFAPVIFSSPLAYFLPVFRNVIWFRLLCHIIGSSGAAFIKWGQWSSTRPDMFPEELCIALSQLHSRAPVHGYSFTKNQIYSEFGLTISEMFESFSEKPIASGSIAQVYKARLDGKDVAVKVRHPGVVEQIQIGK